jgi:hypothetical protein
LSGELADLSCVAGGVFSAGFLGERSGHRLRPLFDPELHKEVFDVRLHRFR